MLDLKSGEEILKYKVRIAKDGQGGGGGSSREERSLFFPSLRLIPIVLLLFVSCHCSMVFDTLYTIGKLTYNREGEVGFLPEDSDTNAILNKFL